MKKLLGSLLLSALFCPMLAPLPALAAADAASDRAFMDETPLMVIRFNQPHVHYETPLYQTLQKVLQIKPGAVFDVVSIAPRARESQNQPGNNEAAQKNTHKVLATLNEIGMPASRISLIQAVDAVDASEVRIYVH